MASNVRRCRSLLRSCARHALLDDGKKIHAVTITSGLLVLPNSFLRNVILHLYATCGDELYARKLFDAIPITGKDTVDWATMMNCYIRIGLSPEALSLFVKMRRHEVLIDEITAVLVLTACSKVGNKTFGIQGHGYTIQTGLDSGVKACNAAMDMYVKCGSMEDAMKLFDEMTERTVVSWTIILWGVVKWEGLEMGRIFFDEMTERNEIAWTIIMAAYIENGFIKEAFRLLSEMLFTFAIQPNFPTLCSLLSACSQSGDTLMGKWVHLYALKTSGTMNVLVATSLIDMYGKCGQINQALKVFNSMNSRTIVTWNCILSVLAMHGKGLLVLNMLNQMLLDFKPDEMTFTSVLSACSHSGLVDQGRDVFNSLKEVYGITPSIENYASLVDLLGRAGHLKEAESIVKAMPIPPNEVVLGSLLGACSVHKAQEQGERLLQDLIELYPNNTEYHILLSNVYASYGNREKADTFRRVLRDKGLRKVPGISSIYIHGQIHHFCAGDKTHPLVKEIYLMLNEVMKRLKLSGYVPNITSQIFSASDFEMDSEEEKELALQFHSEKLALSFGLMSTRKGTSLHIFKNLRTCQDCHSAMKIISRIYEREIVLRDRNRFHCFKFGSCSCGDYW